MPPDGPDPNDAQIRGATSSDTYAPGPLRDGLYVIDQCGTPGCGGIYLRGNVQQMELKSEAGMQTILVQSDTSWDPAQRYMKIIIDPRTRAIQTCASFTGNDGGDGTCSGWTLYQTYPAGTFSGVFYIDGAITSASVPSGLWGRVNRDMRLTIAALGEIRITNQLNYEAPPAAPGHNPINVLGLWSRTSDVTIVGVLTPNDLYIDAAVLAPSGRFWVEGWNSLPVKGNVHFLGGTVQGTFGAFGGFSPDTGYGRVMTYDWRLRSNISPPFFPVTDVFTAVRWPAPSPAFANGDPLYERPQWEELVGF